MKYDSIKDGIAIIGMACRYADARSPQELWENVLSKRQAFRRIPPQRLSLEDYYQNDRTIPDSIYSTQAALIEGYEFDRVRFRIVGETFRSADLAHWLALDMAWEALGDAGFEEGKGLPKQTTGVLLGNTLTGEFSRANTLRLRWPYVRRVVEGQLKQQGMSPQDRQAFLGDLETQFKAPFSPIDEESLAGNLSNTIAGRICNYFDLQGGGYTIDGACSSSLLAVAHACSALVAGDLDVAIAGGIDISLDPFELVGFAKAGALAQGEMRVYDRGSDGFIPGEGCGFVVLMRYQDALAQHKLVYSIIRGWGISSDGHGGITRPEVDGQLLALKRAYHRAGWGIDTVAYFEGHGTGTRVGDDTELEALSRARTEQGTSFPLAVLGSIKANIGHTKAAAGVAGLIKATMALHTQILPPITGCEHPHPKLTQIDPALQVLKEGQQWSEIQPLRAGVSAMGFGGINTHLVLEGVSLKRRQTLTQKEQDLLSTPQDAELILITAANWEQLRQKVQQLLNIVPQLSKAEMTDLAVNLGTTLDPQLPIRAAIVASNPQELTDFLETLLKQIGNREQGTGEVAILECDSSILATVNRGVPDSGGFLQNLRGREQGIFLGNREQGTGNKPKIGFLFPGQASPVYLDGGVWQRRFPFLKNLYATASLPREEDNTSTAIAQPAIITASVAGLQVLHYLGIEADVAVGHSLGELCALHWGGAMDATALIGLARVRGQMMSTLSHENGTMASIGADEDIVKSLLNGHIVAIAGLNSPTQTVISGEATAVNEIVKKAQVQGLKAVHLPVSAAFHSPLVADTIAPLREYLRQETFYPLQKTVISTVTGSPLDKQEDLRALLCQQITSPVRFMEAVSQAGKAVDLFIEVGTGGILSRLVGEFLDIPVVALDAGGNSLKGLLQAVGSAFALGVSFNYHALFERRFSRPLSLDWQPQFFSNPCESNREQEKAGGRRQEARGGKPDRIEEENTLLLKSGKIPNLQPLTPLLLKSGKMPDLQSLTPIDCVRQLVAQRTELPLETIQDNHRLLGDLHLNSITVSQLVIDAARSLGLSPPLSPTDYAGATVAQVAQALEELSSTHKPTLVELMPSGVDSWIRTYTVELVESLLPTSSSPALTSSGWCVLTREDYPLKTLVEKAFTQCGGTGVVVCLPPNLDEDCIDLLLAASQAILARYEPETSKFVLVQHGGGGASFGRTFHLEHPSITTWIVDVPLNYPQSVQWIVTEATLAKGYGEAYYDETGKRRSPSLRLLPLLTDISPIPLTADDVLLVTGGGKGIAAECALSVARETGVKLALLGRSKPDTDAELAQNLSRLRDRNIPTLYIAADVSDAEAVKEAVCQIEAKWGKITAVIHGAGVNPPKLIENLDKNDFLGTLAPKVKGLQNLFAALNPQNLKLLVTFGSIIARTGLPGEAHYGLANDWLGCLVAQFQVEHPLCRCLNLEWSVWSGVGMGERLGRVDALMGQGITPIPPDTGINLLLRLLAQPLPTASVVITGRFGNPPTLKAEQPQLPFLRFLEEPRVYYRGVELIVDAQLSTATDPYLNDHIYQGERIFPGVMGLEAMAQVGMALLETSELPLFEDVKFVRPIIVSQNSPLKIRIAALRQESGKVDVVIRSEQTGFVVDHFRAILTIKTREQPETKLLGIKSNHFMPATAFYGNLLFQGGRFQRLQGYRYLRATECIADIAVERVTPWFSHYLPDELILGDPGARDAVIHALQACVPQATILPTGIERLTLYSVNLSDNQFVSAKERQHLGDTFIYDLEVFDSEGNLLETWEGLELRVIKLKDPQDPWISALLPPYMERQIKEVIPNADLTLVIDHDATVERRVRSDRSLFKSQNLTVIRRPDGKPELNNGQGVSVSHAGDLTLVVMGSPGCDVEPVVSREVEIWRDLLGVKHFDLAQVITQEIGEDLAVSATRVWCAKESLKKAEASIDIPLTLLNYPSLSPIKSLWLASGERMIATFVVSVREFESPLVFAVLVEGVKGSTLPFRSFISS